MGSGTYDDRGLEPTEQVGPARLIGGKYRLGRLLGEGAMGAVYEAEHVELGSRVAVKLLGETFAFDEMVAARARREGRAAASIRHDNIVTILDTGIDEGVPYLVMELLEGESLGTVLRRELRFEPRLACAVLAEILDGVAAAHDQGVLHRDLKPDNIFLARSSGGERVKVLDFGVSKLTGDDDATLTAAGVALGTPHYMAPEQVERKDDLDHRVDLYAAGVVMYRMITGQLPFAGVPGAERDAAIRTGDFPEPSGIIPELPPELEALVMRAMATDRDERFADARAFRAALLEIEPAAADGLRGVRGEITLSERSRRVSSSGATANPTAPAIGPASRKSMAVAAVLAVALGAIGVALWQNRGADTTSHAASAAPEPVGEPLRFGVATYVPPELQARMYGPLVDHLAARLERPIELLVTRDSAELSRRFLAGDIEIAALNPLAYVRARAKVPEVRVLAAPVTAGGASFEVHIVSRAESDIDEISDLHGKVFCYVPSAASGYLVPRVMLRRAGLDPDHDFSATHLVPDHLAGLRYVDSSVCDATAVYASLLFESDEHGLNPYAFRIVDTSERIPNDAYCASPALGADDEARLREALLALEPGSELAAEVFGAGGEIIGFAAARDGDYDPMRAADAEEAAATGGATAGRVGVESR